jgi:hypothetical protein
MIFKLIFVVVVMEVAANPLPNLKNDELFEGDMKLNGIQRNALHGILPKTGWTELVRRWPKNAEGFVTVPYRLDERYSEKSRRILVIE